MPSPIREAPTFRIADEGHKRALTPDPDQVVEHRPCACSSCGEPLPADLPAEIVSVHERIDLPPVRVVSLGVV